MLFTKGSVLGLGLVLLCIVNVTARSIQIPATFKDIQKGIDNANPGDTVWIDSGFYKETIELHDSVVVMGTDREDVVISGVENRPVVVMADYAVISSVTIRGGSVGVLCPNKTGTIERCIITQNRESGIHCLIALPLIRNNIISRNKLTGIYCESVRSLRGVALEHNVLAENGYSGLNLAGRCEIMITNNVLMQNKQYGIWASPGSRKCLVLYNCFFNNRHSGNKNITINTTNIAVDPAYQPLGQASYDYLRSRNSPLRGLGKDGVTIGLFEGE